MQICMYYICETLRQWAWSYAGFAFWNWKLSTYRLYLWFSCHLISTELCCSVLCAVTGQPVSLQAVSTESTLAWSFVVLMTNERLSQSLRKFISISFSKFYIITVLWRMVWKHCMQYLWVCHCMDMIQKENKKQLTVSKKPKDNHFCNRESSCSFVTEHCLVLITSQLQAHCFALPGALWKSYWRGEGFLHFFKAKQLDCME